MPDPKPQFNNFKEAYCAAHRCAPERYDRSVFHRCLYRHAVLLARPVWWWDRHIFQPDFELIAALGQATTETELQILIDEFENYRQIERAVLHATFHIRLSTTRLRATFQELLPLIKPPVIAPVPAQTLPVAGNRVTGESIESTVLIVRRLKRFHAEMVLGHSQMQAAAAAGIELGEVRSLLARHKEDRPELVWLDEYLNQSEQLEKLLEENARLTRLTTELTQQLFLSSDVK